MAEDADAPASFAVAQTEEDMMEAAAVSPTAPGPASRNTCGTSANNQQNQVAPAQAPTVAVPALEPDTAMPCTETVRVVHLESSGALPPSSASSPGVTAYDEGPARVPNLQTHLMPEATVPAESSTICDSGYVRSDSTAVNPADKPQDAGNAGHHLLHACSTIRPPRPQSAVQPKALPPFKERPNDAPIPSPSISPQCDSLDAAPAVQDSGAVRSEPCQQPGASTADHTAVARNSAHQESTDGVQQNAVGAETRAVTKECGAADPGSVTQTKQSAAQARVLTPLHNVMDQCHTHESGSNMDRTEARPSLPTPAEQQSEMTALMPGKRKMAGHSLPVTASKERRLDLTNSESITNTVPGPQPLPTRQVGIQQTEASTALPGSTHQQPLQQTGSVQTCVGAAAHAAHLSSHSMSAQASGSEIPAVDMDSAAGCTSTSGKVPDYRKALAELSASLQEVSRDPAPHDC